MYPGSARCHVRCLPARWLVNNFLPHPSPDGRARCDVYDHFVWEFVKQYAAPLGFGALPQLKAQSANQRYL